MELKSLNVFPPLCVATPQPCYGYYMLSVFKMTNLKLVSIVTQWVCVGLLFYVIATFLFCCFLFIRFILLNNMFQHLHAYYGALKNEKCLQ